MFCSKQMLSSCLQGKPSWVSRVVQQLRCICLQHAHTALGHAANAMCCRYGTSLSMPCTDHRHTQSRNPSYNLANPGQGSSRGQVGGPAGTGHAAPQQISQDLGTSALHPIQAVLAWHDVCSCFVFFLQDQDTATCVGSSTYYPVPAPFLLESFKEERK